MGRNKDKIYRTYLVRCWRQNGAKVDEQLQWRFSLHEILEEKREFGFGSYDELVEFLQSDLLREDLWQESEARADG